MISTRIILTDSNCIIFSFEMNFAILPSVGDRIVFPDDKRDKAKKEYTDWHNIALPVDYVRCIINDGSETPSILVGIDPHLIILDCIPPNYAERFTTAVKEMPILGEQFEFTLKSEYRAKNNLKYSHVFLPVTRISHPKSGGIRVHFD